MRTEAEKNAKFIRDAPPLENVDTWCNDCKKDMFLRARKRVTDDDMHAFYEARCPHCGRTLQRFITDKHLDPFWKRSRLLQETRKKYADDILQPGDPRYRLLYGYSAAEKEEIKREEAKEKREWKQKRETSKSFIAL